MPVNAVCAWIGEPGEAIPETDLTFPVPLEASSPAGDALNGVEPDAPATTVAPDRTVAAAAPGVPARSEERIRISPRASRLAASAGLDPRDITGTGPNGRVTERDVQARIAAPTASDAAPIETALAPDGTAPAPRPVAPASSPSAPAVGHAPAPPGPRIAAADR